MKTKVYVNNTDISSLITSLTSNIEFSNDALIGNAPSMELSMKANNENGEFDTLLDSPFILKKEDGTQLGVFNVIEKPERMTSELTLELYDNMVKTNINYDSQLAFPTTIKNILDEISDIIVVDIDYSQMDAQILNQSINFWDNTELIRSHLRWIAEKAAGNFFADVSGGLVFIPFSTTTKHTIPKDDVEQFEKIENFILSGVLFDNGINPMLSGTETNNVLYLDSQDEDNPYISTQSDVDFIYGKLNGLSFWTSNNIKIAESDSLQLGEIINIANNFTTIPISIKKTFLNATYDILEISGEISTKDKSKVIRVPSVNTKIKRLKTIVDQNEATLNIVSQNVEENTNKIGELELSVDNISLEVSESIENISIGGRNLLTHSGNYTSDSQVDWTNFGGGTIVKNDGYIRFNKTSSSTMSPREATTIPIENGETYIIRAKVRSSSGNVEIGLWGNSQQPVIQKSIALNEWTIVSGTVIANEEKQQCYIRNNDTTIPVDGYFDLEWIKLEKGNKPTDWTPAPEDIQNELHDNYYTKTETTAQINVAKDSIASEVSSTYVTKTEFGNLQVGGRNILRKTKKFEDEGLATTNGGFKYGAPVVDEVYKEFTVRGYDNIPISSNLLQLSNYCVTDIDYGEIFTFSFYAKGTISNFNSFFYGDTGYVKAKPIAGSDGVTIQGGFGDGKAPIAIDGEWKRYWVTYQLDDDEDYDISIPKYLLLRIDGNTVENANAYVCGLKLEKGNKPTDWSPAPEDSNFDSSGLKQEITEEYVSLINQTVSQIDMQVSSIQTVVDENGERISDLQTQLAVTNSAVEISKTTIDTLQSALDGKVSQEELVEYVRFDGATVEIGKSDSQFKTVITNEELAFYQGSNKVAWISNNELHVTNAIITTAIGIGSFQFIDEGSLGFSLLLKGSED